MLHLEFKKLLLLIADVNVAVHAVLVLELTSGSAAYLVYSFHDNALENRNTYV